VVVGERGGGGAWGVGGGWGLGAGRRREGEQGGDEVPGQAEQRPALRRLRAVHSGPAARRACHLQDRRRSDQPEWLVHRVREEGLVGCSRRLLLRVDAATFDERGGGAGAIVRIADPVARRPLVAGLVFGAI